MRGKPQESQCGSVGVTGGRESGAIQLSWGAKASGIASGTKMLRKATATETALGTLLPPFSPPHRFAGFPTFPLPPLLTNTPGCDPPAGGCPDLCLCPLPRAGSSSSSALPTRAQPSVSKELQAPRPPPPRPPPADPRPFLPLPGSVACASSSTPAEGTFVSRGTFCLFPLLRLAGRPASPADQSGSEHRRRRRLYLSAPPGKQLADTHTPPEPRKSPGDPGSSLDRRGDRRTLAPRAAPPRSTSRPGLSHPRPQ